MNWLITIALVIVLGFAVVQSRRLATLENDINMQLQQINPRLDEKIDLQRECIEVLEDQMQELYYDHGKEW